MFKNMASRSNEEKFTILLHITSNHCRNQLLKFIPIFEKVVLTPTKIQSLLG